jgi:hypothetical protein
MEAAAEALRRRGKLSDEKQCPEKELTQRIIAAAIEVHRKLGPGYLKAIYE